MAQINLFIFLKKSKDFCRIFSEIILFLHFISFGVYSTHIIYTYLTMDNREEMLLKSLWEKVKEWRKKAKISQAELSEKSWIDRSYISMVERWETNITYLKLKKICNVIWIGIEVK